MLTNNIKGNSKMNYTNYERQITEKFGVVLCGWPLSGHVRNPAKVGGTAEVEKLLDALKSGKCKWVKLTAEELAARITDNKACQAWGEQIYGPRRRHNVTASEVPSEENSE